MHAIDDERHLVFECPAFEEFRVARKQLFNRKVGENMKAFMTQKDQRGVMWFVLDCLRCVSRQDNVHNQA